MGAGNNRYSSDLKYRELKIDAGSAVRKSLAEKVRTSGVKPRHKLQAAQQDGSLETASIWTLWDDKRSGDVQMLSDANPCSTTYW